MIERSHRPRPAACGRATATYDALKLSRAHIVGLCSNYSKQDTSSCTAAIDPISIDYCSLGGTLTKTIDFLSRLGKWLPLHSKFLLSEM